MSTIEQAAKRLEDLEKGTDAKSLSTRLGTAQDVLTSAKPTVSTLEKAISSVTSRPSIEASEESFSPAMLRKTAPVRPHQPQQKSKRLEIDLARLSATGVVTADAPNSKLANEFRVIKRPLITNAQGKSATPILNANMIMVTSALPGEGKSFTSLNLAMSIAMEMDNTVLLIDADVANPSLLKLLGLPASKGLMDVLTEPNMDLGDVLLTTNVKKLSLLPAGSPHQRATELLASEAMKKLVDEIAVRYHDRIIVFDSPPLLPTTESRVLANHMGQIVLVVEADKTTHSSLKEAMTTIDDCQVVMTVLNKSTGPETDQYYGGYRYGHAR